MSHSGAAPTSFPFARHVPAARRGGHRRALELSGGLAVGPMVAAIAAGNRMLVKMSEAAPATGELFASRSRATSRPSASPVVQRPRGGEGVLRLLDHLLFTGSTAVGRQVMRGRRGEPHAGHARAGRQVAVGRDFAVEEGEPHSVPERGPDLHRARLLVPSASRPSSRARAVPWRSSTRASPRAPTTPPS